ncbi:MAG: hypothetical protein KA334_01845, partial [Opitutaceae bacterium]|nr:hypothetical protein [Opitutaceae bacterium]
MSTSPASPSGRRQFLAQGIGLTAAALAAPALNFAAPDAATTPATTAATKVPEFEWGVATAAIQV